MDSFNDPVRCLCTDSSTFSDVLDSLVVNTVYEKLPFLENIIEWAVRRNRDRMDNVGFDVAPGMSGTVRALGRDILIEGSTERNV